MADPKDSKSIAAILVGKMGKKPEDGSVDSRQIAAEDILSAIESKDPAALKDALAAFVDGGEDEPAEPPM